MSSAAFTTCSVLHIGGALCLSNLKDTSVLTDKIMKVYQEHLYLMDCYQ